MESTISIDDTEALVFRGLGCSDCGQFIRDLRRAALKLGKQRDDAYMADLAASSMADDALSWHLGLDRETRESWELLQRALAKKYLVGERENSTRYAFLDLSDTTPQLLTPLCEVALLLQ